MARVPGSGEDSFRLLYSVYLLIVLHAGGWASRDGQDRRRGSDYLQHLSQLSRAKNIDCHSFQPGALSQCQHCVVVCAVINSFDLMIY